MSIVIGTKGREETVVCESNTAAAVGSGMVPVFATPFMIALMEGAAAKTVLPFISEDESTVGTHLNVSHSAATPIGMKVWAEATVTAAEGKKITFEVVAYDEEGEIGRGTHERFIIRPDKFLAKVQAKLNK